MAAKTTQAIADVLADTITKARAAGAHHEAHVRQQSTTATMETLEGELAQRWRETFLPLLEADGLHPDLEPMVRHLTEPGHQSDFLFQLLSIAGLVMAVFPAAATGRAQGFEYRSMREWGDTAIPAGAVVDAYARRIYPEGALDGATSAQGFRPETVHEMVVAARRAPSIGEALAMLHRGAIGDVTFSAIVEQSGVQDEYLGAYDALKVNPPSTEEALIAELEGYLSAGEVEAIMRLNGDDPASHDWRYESRGQPPPIGEMVRLWRRGFISDGEVHDALLEGPVKNKYIPAIMRFKEVLPSFRQVQNMAHVGLLTEPEAIDLLIQNGYSPTLAGKMIAYATREKVAKEHDETKAEVLASYGLRMVDRDQAAAMLRQLGFTDRAATAALDLVDAKYHRRLLDEAVARVRAAYIGWRITEDEASAKLDALLVPSTMRDDLLHTWEIEHELNRKHLTPAQISGAVVRGLLSPDDGLGRLRAQGLTDEDARIVLGLQQPKPKAAKA